LHVLTYSKNHVSRSITPAVAAFFDELRLNGFVEGRNLMVISNGFGIRNDDKLTAMAAAIVKAAPDAIVGGPEPELRALQAATQTVPLIGVTGDMLAEGLVASVARPGGNTTGISILAPELDSKRQEFLVEAVPGVRRMAALADSNVTPPQHLKVLEDGAAALISSGNFVSPQKSHALSILAPGS
jgi:putative ABC transport system substrate-binding protein